MNIELTSLLRGFHFAAWGDCPSALPSHPASHVYAVGVQDGDANFVLYVGQTADIRRRFGDYDYRSWHAPTDFRVGEAVKYFRDSGCTVRLYFKGSENPRVEERILIREMLLQGSHLLNCLTAFDYQKAVKEDERRIIHRFCDMARAQAARPST